MPINRTRELIYKPVFHGAPLTWTTKYFQKRLKEFRKAHKEFNMFLNTLNRYLKKETDNDYSYLRSFIKGEAEPNSISPSDCLFDILIKLYNLCLSPQQAYEYIKECHQIYLFMFNNEYEISNDYEYSIRRSTWDGKNKIFINIKVMGKETFSNRDNYYWFEVPLSDDYLNYLNYEILEFHCPNDKMHDSLKLFVNYQHKEFYKKIINSAISGFKENKYISNLKTIRFIDSLKKIKPLSILEESNKENI